MIHVYVKKWSRKDGPWERVLACILKRDYQMEPCPEIVRDEMGKPYLKNNAIFFNVSHSGEYLAIAVSDGPVGIDIQKGRNIREGMYRRVVRQEEQALIGRERQRDFLRLWTLKESFVKAEGKGLRIPMKEYFFVKEKDRYFVNYHGQKALWTFNIEEELLKDYFISVCGLEQDVLWHME